jgi:WhiB family transcriptional regulator, redox-sensing transcriptional regulator
MTENKDRSWMQWGLCLYAENKDLWFPEAPEVTKQAKAVCAECPVLQECREYAITFPTTLRGVWGGLTFKQLRAERIARGLKVESEHEFSKLPVEGKGYYSDHK